MDIMLSVWILSCQAAQDWHETEGRKEGKRNGKRKDKKGKRQREWWISDRLIGTDKPWFVLLSTLTRMFKRLVKKLFSLRVYLRILGRFYAFLDRSVRHYIFYLPKLSKHGWKWLWNGTKNAWNVRAPSTRPPGSLHIPKFVSAHLASLFESRGVGKGASGASMDASGVGLWIVSDCK